MPDTSFPRVHRVEGSLFPVNAYIVETRDAVVIVDAMLGVTDGRALRARADALGKPIAAVVVTHAHPDHYGGISPLLDGLDVPILAVAGVDAAIRRDDAAKEQILRPMFGAEWPQRRTFPNRTVKDGDVIQLGGATFRVVDLGPGESPHDSLWLLEADGRTIAAFAGDLTYGHMHGYLADGFYEGWLANIARARGLLGADATLYIGHGEPGPAGPLLDWQERYVDTFIDAVTNIPSDAESGTANDAAATERVTQAMQRYLPGEDLLFLMQLSVPPMRRILAGEPREDPPQ
ncbi:MAG: MBL fold metallo-hydrolase [Microbacterium sp.]|uniref:MBL fold metallo-hydrolase n=1 Tax=Microbacterium sp. TaxID=51671 RepID=UPI001DCF04F5|nr:MBL fold metallo-hydrolase [Microbacterium sp.]MBW8764628.1 MBL fold metallo-hydrolase [Microbacterium sp.]